MASPALVPWSDARTPALAVVAKGDQIENVSPTVYFVHSQSKPDRKYQVRSWRDRWSCSCSFFQSTNRRCIHILEVRIRDDLREGDRLRAPVPECTTCESQDVVADGKRRNKAGNVPRYLCKNADTGLSREKVS